MSDYIEEQAGNAPGAADIEQWDIHHMRASIDRLRAADALRAGILRQAQDDGFGVLRMTVIR